jgi:hypothetical protein
MAITKKRLIVVGLFALLVAMLVLVGCAPRERDPNAGGGLSVAWSPDADCTGCHKTEAATLNNTQVLAGEHKSQPTVKCASCHNDITALTAIHANAPAGNANVGRMQTKVADAACTASGCHSDASVRVAATANNKILTDMSNRTVNPHNIPLTNAAGVSIKEHVDLRCVSCHTGHKVTENVKKVCVDCHHEDEFECNTCH